LDNPTLESELSVFSVHSASEPDLSKFIIEEDHSIEGEGWSNEMWESNTSGLEGNVKWSDVTEDGNESGFGEETEVTEGVPETLLGDGEVSGLADKEISPLDTDDGAKVAGLGILKSFSGVADWVVRVTGVSVEVWIVLIISWPSAGSPHSWVSGSGIPKSDIVFSMSFLVPSHSESVSILHGFSG